MVKTEGNSSKVVIGENMSDRVIPYAEEIGAKYYKPRSTNPDNWLNNNKKWLQKEIKNGSYDKGIDPTRETRSKYYEMEQSVLRKNNIEPIKVKE